MSNRPDITLYTAQTPNGIKISIALEELGYVAASTQTHLYQDILQQLTANTNCRLPYKVEKIDISKNTQKEPYVSTTIAPSTT
jgi:glutathione S-transferase